MNSYTSENRLMIYKPKCGNNDITAIRTSSESPPHWRDHFHKNPLFSRIIAGFEAGNEIEDRKAVCNKTTNILNKTQYLMVFL